jgi:predicted nucleic acid-binding protein
VRVLVDTNYIVALAVPAHDHHLATFADYHRRRSEGHQLVVAAHSLVEAYSVLTRMPPPFRLAPADAFVLLDQSWGKAEAYALTAAECWRMVRSQAARGVAGGRIHDYEIAECARKAKADEILTWNVRHFDAAGVRAVAPA